MSWTIGLGIVGVVLGLWALLELKTSRPDGTVLKVHPYRRLLVFITPGRAQSTVSFDTYVDAEALLAYVEDADEAFGAHLTHAVVAAVFTALAEVPRMNRFIAGRRLYQRDGEWLTFSMKRKKLDRDAKISMVKLKLQPG